MRDVAVAHGTWRGIKLWHNFLNIHVLHASFTYSVSLELPPATAFAASSSPGTLFLQSASQYSEPEGAKEALDVGHDRREALL